MLGKLSEVEEIKVALAFVTPRLLMVQKSIRQNVWNPG